MQSIRSAGVSGSSSTNKGKPGPDNVGELEGLLEIDPPQRRRRRITPTAPLELSARLGRARRISPRLAILSPDADSPRSVCSRLN